MGFNEMVIYIYGQEREILQYFSTTFDAFSSVYNTIYHHLETFSLPYNNLVSQLILKG